MSLLTDELVRDHPPPVAEVAALTEIARVPVTDLEERHFLFGREAFSVVASWGASVVAFFSLGADGGGHSR